MESVNFSTYIEKILEDFEDIQDFEFDSLKKFLNDLLN